MYLIGDYVPWLDYTNIAQMHLNLYFELVFFVGSDSFEQDVHI